jgi:hypothetical protein
VTASAGRNPTESSRRARTRANGAIPGAQRHRVGDSKIDGAAARPRRCTETLRPRAQSARHARKQGRRRPRARPRLLAKWRHQTLRRRGRKRYARKQSRRRPRARPRLLAQWRRQTLRGRGRKR